MSLFEEIFSGRSPASTLHGSGRPVHGRAFLRQVNAMRKMLAAQRVGVLAIETDNSPAWLATDIAAHLEGIVTVPIPAFFTFSQVQHALETSGADTLISWREAMADFQCVSRLGSDAFVLRRDLQPSCLPPGTAKITFTSGTTGNPKGVCLSARGLEDVARSLVEATAGVDVQRHLCVLPLPVLLENLAGAWVAMARRAEIIVPELETLGWAGSSGLDVARLVSVIRATRPDTVILVPQMLQGLVVYLEQAGECLEGLKFAAVGGARVAPGLIERARTMGIPAFEGYGLSECGSVVSLNLPGAERPGSVGRMLEGCATATDCDGQITVRNRAFLGYAGEQRPVPARIETGDLGRIDEDGYLFVEGRSKNVLITGYGRNISPEWVEAELLAEQGIAQAIVVGDGWPRPGALIAAAPGVDVGRAIQRANGRLPDYAHISAWRSIEPLAPNSGLLTANGRVRRSQVHHAFSTFIAEMECAMAVTAGEITEPAEHRSLSTHEVL